MTKATEILQVPARKAGKLLPRALGVGPAIIEVGEATSNNGSHLYSGSWSRQAGQGKAEIEITPVSKATAEVTVRLERPRGIAGLLWAANVRRRLATLFAQALAYDIETRSVEEASPFEVRRTSAELVRARSA